MAKRSTVMALEEFSELWSLYFAAEYMDGMAAKHLRGHHRAKLKRIAAVVRHHADIHREARKAYRKRIWEKEKR